MRVSRLVPNKPTREDVEFNFSKEHMSEIMDLSKTEAQRQAALEMIAFQDGSFYKDLVNVLENHYYSMIKQYPQDSDFWEVYKAVKSEVKKNIKGAASIEEVIKKHTNIKITLNDAPIEFGTCAVYPPDLVFESVLTSPAVSKYVKEMQTDWVPANYKSFLIKGFSKYKGIIDLKKSRVGGFYSNINNYMFVDVVGLCMAQGPYVTAASILHEVGHVFFGLEFAFRTQVCAQVLASLHQQKTQRNNEMVYEQILEVCVDSFKDLGYLDKEIDFEIDTSVVDESTTQTLLFSAVWQKLSYDFGNERSHAPNFEVLADNFAIRHGAARGLFYAIRYPRGGDGKLMENSDYIEKDSLYYYSHVLSKALRDALIGAGVGLFMGPLGLIGGAKLGSAIGFLTRICFSGETKHNLQTKEDRKVGEEFRKAKRTYDNTYIRLVKMREGLIRSLKENKHFSEKDKSIVLWEIEDLNKYLKDYKVKETLYDTIANVVFKERRIAAGAMRIQRQMEQLADNELFVGSQKLKTLSL